MSDHEHDISPDEDIIITLTASEMMNEQEPFTWWRDFEKAHPDLAAEAQRRAYNNTIASGNLSPIERFMDTVNLISFVAEAFRLTAKREKYKTSEEVANSTDDGDGEDPPPLA